MTTPWKVLVVDDEEGIHGITRMIFRGYEFEQRPIELISAMSAVQAKEKLAQHNDIALILLDVVMETDNAGLQLVEYIRQQLNNHHVRIILRTGHPGYAPEADVIVNYDINDYLSKAELSASRLLTAVVVALRAYRDIDAARTASTSTITATVAEDTSLTLSQLSQQSAELLRQHQRLLRLELSPSARDLACELYSQQQRLHNSCRQLHPIESQPLQPVALSTLCEQLINTFLPQTRREGWLLDCSLADNLPHSIQTQPDLLQQLLISAIEIAVLRAAGEDLKLTISYQPEQQRLQFTVQQQEGVTVALNAEQYAWCQRLTRNCTQLCHLLGGQWHEGEENRLRFTVCV